MITIEVLICTINKGIVRVLDNLIPQRENVKYIVSYQYTDERYLELVPKALVERKDVFFTKQKGKGLSKNRNFALSLAKGDVIIFADDDARFSEEGFNVVEQTFELHPELDVAFFQSFDIYGKTSEKIPNGRV